MMRSNPPLLNKRSEVVPFEHQLHLADAFARSGLFGVKTKEQALSLMALCEAEGLHPAKAVQDYDIIQGRPAKKAQAMLASFLQNQGRVEWHERTDEKCRATFTHPAGGTITVDWDLTRAQAAGLASKDNWKKFPRQMLHARVVSEGVRAVFPAATSGLYTPEEAVEFEPIQHSVPNRVKLGNEDQAEKIDEVSMLALDVERIQASKTLDELKTVFLAAKTSHKGNAKSLATLIEEKDRRKREIEGAPIAQSDKESMDQFVREMEETENVINANTV